MSHVRALLVLALGLAVPVPAHAAPFDGAENGGVHCTAALQPAGGGQWVGVLSGGTWAAADVVSNESGVLTVDDKPGPVAVIAIECMIEDRNGTPYVRHIRGGSGVVVMEPVPVAFGPTFATQFRVCTSTGWRRTDGTTGAVPRTCKDV